MIIRSIRTQNFTIIPNLIVEDKSIDWKELGLLVFLLSKPDEWEVSVHHLAKQRKAGRDSILNMLKTLRDAGYVVMNRKHEGGVDYVIYDTPQNRKKPLTENPEVATEKSEPKPEKPLTAFPTMGKATNGLSGHIVNTDKTTSTEKEIVKTELKQNACEEVLDYLNKKTGSAFRPVPANTKLINARLDEGHTPQDLVDVIDMKSEEWQGGKMEQYLRPATLFNAEKFNQYVGRLPDWKKEQSGDCSWMNGLEDDDYIEGEVVNG